jgi:hypothetical protein
MLSLDDPRWAALHGGYRLPYNPVPGLRKLMAQPDSYDVWNEFWNELHHQGDVGDASYAVVPVLVELLRQGSRLGWNCFALCATIEVERHRRGNPPVPDWLSAEYRGAWQQLLPLALAEVRSTTDPAELRQLLAVIALVQGELRLGALLSGLSDDELDEILEERAAWSSLYDPQRAG